MTGAESLRISKVGQTVLARLMESLIWHQLASCVGGGFRKGTMTSARFDARHFSSSLCATGAFQAATLVLELRGSDSESMFGFFKRNCLGLCKFLPLTQSLLAFVARYGDLSSWHWNPGLGGWVWAWDPCSRDIPPEFLSTTCGCETSPFAALP